MRWIPIAVLMLTSGGFLIWNPFQQGGGSTWPVLMTAADDALSSKEPVASTVSLPLPVIEGASPLPQVDAVKLCDLDEISFSKLSEGQPLVVRDSSTGEELAVSVSRVIRSATKHSIAAVLEGPMKGWLVLDLSGQHWQGLAQIPERNRAFRVHGLLGGPIRIDRALLSDLICARPRGSASVDTAVDGAPIDYGLPRPTNRVIRSRGALPDSGTLSIPILRSRPSSTRVIYLDFDGEIANDPWWNSGNTINAAPSGMTDLEITEAWRRVVEDFDMFDVNVTTLLSDYDNAAVGRRTHCVITPTDTAMPGAGGVAYVDSFESGARYCWGFIVDNPKDCAEVISHEVGHTLGLNHDGRTSPVEEYYAGHGNGATGWAPIMGIGYYQQLVQWSKGEYLSADNTAEDDIAIITNKTPLISDDHANTTGAATAVNGALITGIIEKSADVDVFKVSLTAGTYVITLQPDQYSNLDAVLEILGNTGSLIATSNPPDLLSASNQLTVASSNIYYLRVKPTGKGDVLGTGYSSYGSIGGYTIQGFGNQQQAPSAPIGLTVRKVSATQLELSWQIVASATHYEIFRNSLSLGMIGSSEFVDTQLMPSTLYIYETRAINSYGTSSVSSAAGMITPAMDEFIMDGAHDFARYTLSSPGMVINAAIRGNRLYVSTWSPGSNYSGFGNDHHIFISDQLLPAATTPAPWAKRGFVSVASSKPYLAGEYTTDYAGWFNVSGSSLIYKSASASGQLEGSIDLVQQFGSIPATVYIAVVAYQSDDASGADASLGRINAQAPAAVISNDNLEPQEFLAIPTASIRDSSANGFYDVLSSSREFRSTIPSTASQNGMLLEWPSIPGISYQLYRSSDLGSGAWSNIFSVTAGQTNWSVRYHDTAPFAAGCYYQIRWQP